MKEHHLLKAFSSYLISNRAANSQVPGFHPGVRERTGPQASAEVTPDLLTSEFTSR